MTEDTVYLWKTRLHGSELEFDHAWATLDLDERRKADRFHFQRDRKHFVFARALLRRTLGNYLGVSADEVQFAYSPHGKPSLWEAKSEPYLSFNVSHSKDYAIFAFIKGRCQIGVDVEFIQPIQDIEEIAKQFFTQRETDGLLQLASREQIPAFYRLWCRKEAFLKAHGKGLSYPLNQVEVTFLEDDPIAILSIQGSAVKVANWAIHELNTDSGFEAALVCDRQNVSIQYC